jgi:putative phosphoesterase
MRILIVSDIHDHIHNLRSLFERKDEVDAVIGLGDYCAPFVVRKLAQFYQVPIHIIWGNNDGDRSLISLIASNFQHISIHGEYLKLVLDEVRIFASHYPEIARNAADSGNFDLVCYGHDHVLHAEQRGDTLLVNPGTLMGYHPGRDDFVPPTYGIYDTEIREFKHEDITDSLD